MSEAIISVTNVQFSQPKSTATFTLQQPAPDGIKQMSAEVFAVWAPMTLVFQFDPAGPYVPIGRAWFKENGSKPVNDPDGSKNLVGHEPAPNGGRPAMSIDNKWLDHARAVGEVGWKFSFRIQPSGGGQPSEIDPEISNTDQVPDVPPGKKKRRNRRKRTPNKKAAPQKKKTSQSKVRPKRAAAKNKTAAKKKPARKTGKRRH
jgi:hypothetical protein